jgi:hypothetical protein
VLVPRRCARFACGDKTHVVNAAFGGNDSERFPDNVVRQPQDGLMANLNFPPPTDHQEFERLVADVAGPVLGTPLVSLNGRTGQAQAGVDVSVTGTDGTHIGVQCKLTTAGLPVATVREEVAKARDYRPLLSRFIIATTARSDAPLQQAVRELPAEKFSVELWSWDDINNHMNRLPGVAIPYAEHVLLGSQPRAEHEHAEHLREALDRPAFLRRADAEHSFADQREAVQDTSSFLRTGRHYTRTQQFVSALPYRRYSPDYSARLQAVMKAVDAMDNHLRRSLDALQDFSSPDHLPSMVTLDAKRMEVLKAANRVFTEQGLDPLEPSS